MEKAVDCRAGFDSNNVTMCFNPLGSKVGQDALKNLCLTPGNRTRDLSHDECMTGKSKLYW